MLVGGRYEIIRELGRGGFGKTYLAEDTYRRGNPKCVVKKISLRSKDPAVFRASQELFETETQALYRLGTYDQIAKLYGHFEQNGEFYLVQALIDGQNLRQMLPLGMKLEEEKAIDLLREILEILACVHQHGVIHQDIKPDNFIRRWTDKKLVLMDFGGVKTIRHLLIEQGQPKLMQTVGAPGYTPTEQVAGQLTPASDLYAAGMIAIQALTGLLPTQIPRQAETSELSWHDQATVSDEFSAILDRMVRYRVEERYQSAAEILAVLPTSKSTNYAAAFNTLLEEAVPQYQILIKPQFEAVCHFAEGLAAVSVQGKLGFIDRSGQFVIRPNLPFNSISMFRGAYLFSEGLARADMQGQWGYLGKTGEWLIPPQFDGAENFAEGLARVEIGHEYGYIDRMGFFVIKPQFESAAINFSSGLAAVEIDHRHGYIDRSGRVVIQPQFDSADDFVEDLARVTVDHQYGFIDQSGQFVIQPQFDVAHTFSEGLARVRIDGKYGYIDRTGAVVIPPQFDDTFSFSNGLALIRNGAKYGFINKAGKIIIRLQFDDAYPFSDGLAAVKLINLWGFMDTQGDMAIDLQYENAGSFTNEMAAVKSGNQWGFVGRV